MDGCKEVFPHRGLSDDDDNGGQDCGEGVQTGDHARITAIASGGALGNSFSDSRDHSEHGNNKVVAGWRMSWWTACDSDPYKLAIHDQPNTADDSVFYVECYS